MKPSVSVVILSFNRREALGRALRALGQCADEWSEVIVVDNASGDGSAEMVAAEFPQVRLVRLGRNRGISAWNEGFRVARGDHFFVLDDDSYPAPGAINAAVQHATANPGVGLVACRVENPETGCCVTERLAQPGCLQPDGRSYVVNDFIGCGALISAAVYRDIGGFEPDIFIYAHELEYSMRALASGHRTHYLPAALVYHERAFTTKRREAMFCFHNTRNFMLCVRRFCPPALARVSALYTWVRNLPLFLANGWLLPWLRLSGMALLPGRAGPSRYRADEPLYVRFARGMLSPAPLRTLARGGTTP